MSVAPARADFRLCNNTTARVSVALAYTNGSNWVSEGWWNIKASNCETLLRGPLAAQYYYIYAMDERGGEWKGKAFMCTRDREFRIDGREDCFVRGYRPVRLFRGRHRQGRQELDGSADRSRPAALIAKTTRKIPDNSFEEAHEQAPPPLQDPGHARTGLQ